VQITDYISGISFQTILIFIEASWIIANIFFDDDFVVCLFVANANKQNLSSGVKSVIWALHVTYIQRKV